MTETQLHITNKSKGASPSQQVKSVYLSKVQVNTLTHIEVIRQNVLSHTRAMAIGVSIALKILILAFTY